MTIPGKWLAFAIVGVTVASACAVAGVAWYHAHAAAYERNRCTANLLNIDSAVLAAALTLNLKAGATVDEREVTGYLRPSALHCPAGGRYTIRPVGQYPTCSVHGDLVSRSEWHDAPGRQELLRKMGAEH